MHPVTEHNPTRPTGGWFRRFATRFSNVAGTPYAFFASLAVIAIWAITGPMFGFSDTWQLVINTGTTIVTFLMVFVVQNTQNRDALAIHLKLDELIKATAGARNTLIDLERLDDGQLRSLEAEYKRICDDEEAAS